MTVPRLPNKEFIAYLRRHPIPELMDDKCLAAFSNIEEQFGEELSTNAIFEVRLGEEERYVDYVFVKSTDEIPLMKALWYELDYEQFASDKKIEPCLFFTIEEPPSFEEYAEIFDKSLPALLGEERARKLRTPLDKLVKLLPEDAYVRHLGTMSSRGELNTMRLVVAFEDKKKVCKWLEEIGWQGDGAALWKVMEPWSIRDSLSVSFDIGENGIMPGKIGLEIPASGEHPVLVNMLYIKPLEQMGLCLKSKGDGLRRWINLSPCAEPFIQTRMQYFKLNFLDGKVTEAKAYLEHSPHLLHNYFQAYERPLYVEFMLKDEKNILPIGTAMKYLYDCEYDGIRRIHFLGDVAGYEHLDRLLLHCQEGELFVSIEISGKVTRRQLKDMIDKGANEFTVAIENISALKMLQELGVDNVRAKWFMDGENFRELKDKVELATSLSVKELIITGMKPVREGIKKSAPNREALEETARFIKDYEKSSAQMKLSVEPCFSVLRTFMGGEDVRHNNNRGMERGCSAGRDHFCITATGKFSPCSLLCGEDTGRLEEYWENSPALKKLRAMEENRPSQCKGCCYQRRCLPCPEIADCPLAK